ncbi:MAG TPA: hypothetical protein DF774_09145 [Rheinheimera sp.]|uniref:YfiR family protein n=1 Tax=Rheinheimera sp. TaxID=1869214 RepID=UPI000EC3A665|nr:YfiR family protein [Rheinheimera sp.]HCU65912.1 hypothetical protein [Rheinheimera sp.]
MTRRSEIKVKPQLRAPKTRTLFVLLAGFCLALTGKTAAESALDQQKFIGVQAAYIFNLARFVQWPALGSSTFQICLLGELQQKLTTQLQQGTKDKTIQSLPVQILAIDPALLSQAEAEQQLQQCRVLYLMVDPAETGWALLAQLKQPQILRIAAPQVTSQHFSQVDLVFEQGRILLYLNSDSLQQSGLQVNPALLSIARQRTKS